MDIAILLSGILSTLMIIITVIKAIYKKDYTLFGKLFGLIYILGSVIIYFYNETFIKIEFIHLGFIIYLTGDLFASVLYLLLRKQNDKIKQLEALKNLASLSEKYYSIVENTPIGFYVFDATGRIEYVNSYLSSLLGYSRQELIGKSIYDFVHEDYKEFSKNNVTNCINGSIKTLSYIIRMVKKGGEVKFMKITGSKTENGHPTITGSLIEVKKEDLDTWKSQLLS